MKIKNSQIVNAVTVLRQLPTLKQAPKGVHALAKSKNVLEADMEPIQTAGKAAFKDSFGELKEVPANHENAQKFQDAMKAIDDTEVEVTVHQCLLADLNLDKNDISPAQLAAISFIISDF